MSDSRNLSLNELVPTWTKRADDWLDAVTRSKPKDAVAYLKQIAAIRGCCKELEAALAAFDPETKALDLADEMDEYRDQMPGGPHDLLLRAAAALRVKTTSEPTRESIAEAMALVCRPAHYGNNFPEMADAVLALFRAEEKPDALGRYHRVGPDGFCEDCG